MKTIRGLLSIILAGAISSLPGLATAEEILQTIPQPPPGYYTQYFGREVANVGDQNGDGHDDFIAGQPGYHFNNGNTYGAVHLFLGGPEVSVEPYLSVGGSAWDTQLGWSVASLGDFNADGYPDFAAGCPGNAADEVQIFFGGPGLDAVADLVLDGPGSGSRFGGFLASGADLNGDGHPDLAVTAHYEDGPGTEKGRVYLYLGGPDPDVEAHQILDGPAGMVGFGFETHLGGDVTGDGWSDLLVMTWEPHAVYLYAGGPQFDVTPDFILDLPELGFLPLFAYPERPSPRVTAGDLDDDGFDDLVVSMPWHPGGGRVLVLRGGPELDTEPDLVLSGRFEQEVFGRMLDASGDYDGDGVTDLVVGSVGPSDEHIKGYAYIFAGGDLTDTVPEVILSDHAGNRRFGAAAASLGDLDDDGDDELLVGSLSPYGYVWVLDEPFFDIDGNDIDDRLQDFPDCDQDLVPDGSQVLLWPSLDCTGSGMPDLCEILADPTLDCDGNGQIDSCELVEIAGLDCDQDGVLDVCQLATAPALDCDGNGTLDTCDLAAQPWRDCDGDGVLDSCQLAADPGLDCDADGALDACQLLGNYQLDMDQDDILDYCQFPGRLSLFADAAHTTTNLNTTEPGLVGPFHLVLHVGTEAPSATQVELTIEHPDAIPALQIEVNEGLGFDADPTNAGLVLAFPARQPDADGNLDLARVWALVADPAAGPLTLTISENTSAQGNADFDQPVWVDSYEAVRLVTETDAGTINAEASDVPQAGPGIGLAVSNHPNPFNPRTVIRLELPRSGQARLEIVDLAGRLVWKFDVMTDLPGRQEVTWTGTDGQGKQVSSGVYLVRVLQGRQVAQTKLVLLR